MPSSTSIDNYHEHRRSGELGAQAKAILDFLKKHPNKNWSRAEIERATGIRLSSVCGRVNELTSKGLITDRPERPCGVTGKTIRPVRFKRPEH
ncbi:MAG: helix-turn-helix domain-containing protein [Hydrogenophaga sp.]|nr:helix-turn-helix domain-containing protein [Hydrogenophaga sp.]